MKILTRADRAFLTSLKKTVSRGQAAGASVEKAVRTILQAVERGGDKAVLRYTKQFDKVSLKPEALRVTADEIKNAYFHIRKDEGDALRMGGLDELRESGAVEHRARGIGRRGDDQPRQRTRHANIE